MDLSIIIVNYNTKNLTLTCVDSIFLHTSNIDFEVIVVDNSSTDGSVEALASDERIVFIKSDTNLGFGKANNLGFQHAKGKYLLFLNSDTLIYNNVLCEMVNYLEQSPHDIVFAGILLCDKEKNPANSFSYFPNWRNEFKQGDNSNNFTRTEIPYSPCEVDAISGADLFAKRELIEKYGLFDPDFFMYYEDTELGYRYKKAGYKSVIVDMQGIIHLEGASSTLAFRKIRTISRSYLLYLYKTLPRKEWRIAHLLIACRRSLTVWHYPWSIMEKLSYIKLICKPW